MKTYRDGVAVEQMTILDTRESQCERVLAYMVEHGSCSLFSDFGKHISRLPSRIIDLKRRGYAITNHLRKYHESGKFVFNYAEYRIVLK